MRIRKLFSIIMSALVVFISHGCTNVKPHPFENENNFDYDALYRSGSEQIYEDVSMINYTKPSFAYHGPKTQCTNGWSFGGLNNGNFVLGNTDCIVFDREKISISKDNIAVFRYNYQGKEASVSICCRIRLCSTDDECVFVGLYVNDQQKELYSIDGGDIQGIYIESSFFLNKGDNIDIRIWSNNATVQCDPIIYFEKCNQTLYRLTTLDKYYGDVFPWYDEESGKLYMGYLWTDDARNNDYKDALEVSDNMLTYNLVPEANNYETWQRYKQGGRYHFLFDARKVVSFKEYPAGIRDNMVYKDVDNKRMLVIGGVYREFNNYSQSSDLVIYASDDEMGFSWTKKPKIIHADYNKNLPECPTLMKIGNRWYVFVSVAYKTAHQVGALQYWIGDENVDCMDVDWQRKNYNFVDGEDLCAARPIRVRDKVYMWGWIPRTYDTMPWSPWGGYLNLPREIVVRKDGSLGGRMDEGLQRKLDFGKMYVANKDNLVGNANQSWDGNSVTIQDDNLVAIGSFNRNMVRFNMNMCGATKAGMQIVQDGKRYQISIIQNGEDNIMQVSSPDDDKHKVNSTLKVNNNDCYEVMFTIDNGIIEFFVNGEYALTAHTAMTEDDYELGVFSEGKTTFSNICVSKLAPYQSI